MIKKLWFLGITLLLTTSQAIYALTDKDIVFFDVDDVLVVRSQFRNFPDYVSVMLLEAPHSWNIIKTIPSMWSNKAQVKQLSKKFDGDVVIDRLAEQYPVLQEKTKSGKTVAERIKEVASTAKPIPGTIDIIKELADYGITLGIATNQGFNTFTRLINAGTIPALPFTIIFTPDALENNPTDDGYAKKPSKEYFENLFKAAEKRGFTGNKYFIDDKLENVQAAQEVGFIGIHFKNPQQLRNALTPYNMLEKKKVTTPSLKKQAMVTLTKTLKYCRKNIHSIPMHTPLALQPK